MKKILTNRHFSRGAMLMLYIMGLRLIVDKFLDNYVSTAISNVSSDNMVLVYYFIVKFAVMAVVAVIVGRWVKSSYKRILRAGIVVNMLFFISFAFMNSSFISLFITAILEGISMVLFYLPVAVMDTMEVLPEERHSYMARRTTISQILSLVLPIVLGGIITGASYMSASMCMLVVLVLQLVVVSMAKNEKIEKEQYSLSRFLKNLPKDENKMFVVMTLCKGIAIVGAQSQLINLMIYYKLGSEFSLGAASSAISLIAIFVMIAFEKKVNEKIYQKVLFAGLIIQVLCTMWLVSISSIWSVFGIKLCFATIISMMKIIAERCMYDMFYQHKERATEYVIYQEILVNAGRIISWLITAVALVLASYMNGNSFAYAIAAINVFFIVMVVVVSRLVKEIYH